MWGLSIALSKIFYNLSLLRNANFARVVRDNDPCSFWLKNLVLWQCGRKVGRWFPQLSFPPAAAAQDRTI